jgi:glucose/arabinose dehydrogenase
VGGACSSDDREEPAPSTASTPTTSTATSAPSPDRVVLAKVVEVEQPVAMAVRPGEPGFYVAEKTGRVLRVVDGRVQERPVLDLSDRVSTGSEQGLLGLAWSPDGGFLYVNYTDRSGDTRVVEYEGGAGGGREVLFVDQPYANHNGGHLAFTADGRLWIGLGDGGSGGDPQKNAQNLGRLLGKMLRIDPRPRGEQPYGVPPDNPFVGRAGARPEVWALGLRNPWRYSFDRRTGDLWIADVGQNGYEEVNRVATGSKGGENYGWPLREGTHAFRDGAAPPGSVEPVYEYALRDGNCAVVGGYVYRGPRLAALLDGHYLFADSCKGEVMAFSDGRARSLGLRAAPVGSFGEDAEGEVYVLSLSGGVYRLEGAS